LRSLIDELIILLKNQAIAYSNYGLLWTQEILAPLNSTLRWVLLLIAGAILLELYSERGYLFTFWTSIAWEPVLIVIVVALLSYEGLLILAGWLVEQTQKRLAGGADPEHFWWRPDPPSPATGWLARAGHRRAVVATFSGAARAANQPHPSCADPDEHRHHWLVAGAPDLGS